MGYIHSLADFRTKPKQKRGKDDYRVQKKSRYPWSQQGPECYRIVGIPTSHELRRLVGEWERYSVVHRRIRWLMAESRVFIADGCMADPEGILLDVEDAADFEDIGPDGKEVGVIGHSQSNFEAEPGDDGPNSQCCVEKKIVGVFTLQDLFDKHAGKLPSRNTQHHCNGSEIRLSKVNSMIIAEWLRLLDCEHRLQLADINWRCTVATNAIELTGTNNVNTTVDEEDQPEPQDDESDAEVDDADLYNPDADINDLEPLGLDRVELDFWTEIYGDAHLAAHAMSSQPYPPEDSDEPAPHVLATFGFSQERFMIHDT